MILAHKRLSLAAVAMVTALAASLILYVCLFPSSTAAYALEQTVQANDHITSYHLKVNPPSALAGIGEAWVQLAPDGTALRARMDIFGGDRGDRVGIVSKNKAEFWWKANNIRVVTDNKRFVEIALNKCTAMRDLFDPKLAFERLQVDKAAGKVRIATKEPAEDNEPIRLTVTSKGDPDRRHVYEVDPKSKLVERVIEYEGCDGRWKRVWVCNYLDYNVGACVVYQLEHFLAVGVLQSWMFILVLVLSFLVLYVALGRAWCGWCCPLGAVQDGMNGLRARLGRSAPPAHAPRASQKRWGQSSPDYPGRW